MSATRQGSQLNKPKTYNNRGKHTYDLGYGKLTTEKFGLLNPICALNTLERDNKRFGVSYELRNYTLASPMLSNLKKHHDFFFVPMHCILPNTWDAIMTNPVHGEDIDAGFANCRINYYYILSHCLQIMRDASSGSDTKTLAFTDYFRLFLSLLYITSSDSLFTHFKMPLSKMIVSNINDINYYGDSAWYMFISNFFNFSDKPTNAYIRFSSKSATNDGLISGSIVFQVFNDSEPNFTNWRKLIEYCTRYPDFSLDWSYNTNNEYIDIVTPVVGNRLPHIWSSTNVDDFNKFTIPSIIAHKIVVSEFYTDDKVDDIYSASRFKDYIQGLYMSLANADSSFIYPQYTDYSGVSLPYDVFSHQSMDDYVRHSLSLVTLSDAEYEHRSYFWYFMHALFAPEYSFKYVDYFTGARTRPLAVGESSMPVVDGKVDVLDMTESTLITRFLHFVNRVGQRAKDYAREVLGGDIRDNLHEPRFLASQEFGVGTQDVENTSDNQGKVTTLLRSENSRFVFETTFDNDRGIIIGISWYDIPRFYTDCITRFAFHKDRFDMFNPFLQNMGDQAIYSRERGYNQDSLEFESAFGYTQRNMEYKIDFNHACGGFSADGTNLDSWALTVPSESSHICSDFIRSHPSDFDKFYSSLNGLFADYFHFILRYQIIDESSRTVDNNPPLLF